jgi:hypothetical protein
VGTRIRTNLVLQQPGTRRVITNWNTDFLTSDGPNAPAEISLIDLGIPYDTHYRSRIVLPAFAEGYKLNYNSSSNVTFLLVKVSYNKNYDYPKEDDFDPLYWYEPNTYNIEYYFESNSAKTFPIGRLLLLNGSFNNKIEQIYFNNPLGYDVVLDVLEADVTEPVPPSPSSAITISNLYYSDIITNQVPCSSNTGITGSTAFLIYEYNPVLPSGYTMTEYYVPYSEIITMQKDSANNIIYLVTNNWFIILNFLTQFDCDQAYGRMMFAYTSYIVDDCRYLTPDGIYWNGSLLACASGGTSTITPIIYYNPAPSGVSWIGSGTTVPSQVFLHLGSGWTSSDLITLFISGVTDCLDGNIALSSITFLIYEEGSSEPLSGITDNGIYNIVITITNNIGNTTTNYISGIVIDDAPPVVVYRYGVITTGFTENTSFYSVASSAITSGITVLSGFSLKLSGFDRWHDGYHYINRMDIIENIVDYVYDTVDTDINKYMLNVLIAGDSSVYQEVISPGDYLVKISIADREGNEIINCFGTPEIGHYLIMTVENGEKPYSDGQYQITAELGGYIYVSTDYGETWNQKGELDNWIGVDISKDGKYQVAVPYGGQIVISSDFGATWSRIGPVDYYNGIKISGDGQYQTAVTGDGYKISSDYG